MAPELLILGNLALDDVVYENGTTRMAQPGGATLYAALAARLWGVGVGIVSRVGEDYPVGVLDALTRHGVDLVGVRRLAGPSLRTWLLYEGGVRRVVHRLQGPSHREASPGPDEVPEAWDGRAVHLAPMPFDLQQRLVESLASRDGLLLSLDPYELVDADRLAGWQRLLAGVDAFFLSEDELPSLELRQDPRPFLERLVGGRLRIVLYKRGARGGLVFNARQGSFLEWPARAMAVMEPTGAGDAFAGGVLAGLLLQDPLPRSVERGVVAASFAVEGLGPESLLAATPGGARSRLQEWFGW